MGLEKPQKNIKTAKKIKQKNRKIQTESEWETIQQLDDYDYDTTTREEELQVRACERDSDISRRIKCALIRLI